MNDLSEASERVMRLVLMLRQAGATDARVLAAMERTPRDAFAPADCQDMAWDDAALPLPLGQFSTKPSLIGQMLSLLQVEPGATVLEIGVGSGYQTAVLTLLARRVVGLERLRGLAMDARERLGRLRRMQAVVHCADGLEGWPREAAYDRIIVNALVVDPTPFLGQLAEDGVLVAPMECEGVQRLVRFHRQSAAMARSEHQICRFAALQPGCPE